MTSSDFWHAVAGQLHAIGVVVDTGSVSPVSGGCINRAWKIRAADRSLFIKTNDARYQDMFDAEADGLIEIQRAHALRVPDVIDRGVAAGTAWLALEWISRGRPDARTDQDLGESLVTMHRYRAKRFGWHRDNTIGSTPQVNTECDDWAEFFAKHRLRIQIDLAVDHGYAADLEIPGRQLIEALPGFFSSFRPCASLLHGDLWAGNWSADAHGRPYVYDPAVYFGDRETDIAMTRLFGGFGAGFYEAYEAGWPMDADWHARQPLYQLYHILNHVNLFGGGYLGQARALLDQCLAELGVPG